jgi:integrase
MAATMTKTSVPGIYARGRRYTFPYKTPQGRRKWATAATLAEAKVKRAALTTDVARGEYRALSDVTFEQYARDWIQTFKGRTRRGVQEHTRDDYRKRLEREAIPFFGRMRMTEIEPRDVKLYVAEIEKRRNPKGDPVSANTVRLGVAPVRALFADAVEEGVIRSNPAAGLRLFVQRPEVDDEDDVKAMTGDEVARVLAEIPPEYRAFFDFLAQTGLRIGEAVEVRYSDLDFGGRWLHVQRRVYRGEVGLPKGRKKRRVRLTEAMARTLWNRRNELRPADDDLVFSGRGGGRLDPSNLMSRVLKPAAIRAGLGKWVVREGRRIPESWVGFHTFRHTCATMLFRNGWNAVQVQKFLGHSDPGFTLRTYVHLLPEDLPEPDFLVEATSGGVNSSVNSEGRTAPKSADTAYAPKVAISSGNA